MPITVLRKTTTITRGELDMSRLRINEVDQIEAAKAVQAMRQGNEPRFRQIVDESFARVGGVERLIFVLTDQLAKVDK